MENFKHFLESVKLLWSNKRAFDLALIGLSLALFSVNLGPFVFETGRAKIIEVDTYTKPNEIYMNTFADGIYDGVYEYVRNHPDVVNVSEIKDIPLEKNLSLGPKEESNSDTTGIYLTCYDDPSLIPFRTNVRFLNSDFSGFALSEFEASLLVSEENWDPYVTDHTGRTTSNPNRPDRLPGTLCLGREVAFTYQGTRYEFPVTNIYWNNRDTTPVFSQFYGNAFAVNAITQAALLPSSLLGHPSGWQSFMDGVRLTYNRPVTSEDQMAVAKESHAYDYERWLWEYMSAPGLDTEGGVGSWSVAFLPFMTATLCIGAIATIFSCAILFLERKRFVRAYRIYWLEGASEPALFGYQVYHAGALIGFAFGIGILLSIGGGMIFFGLIHLRNWAPIIWALIPMAILAGLLMLLFTLNALLAQKDILGKNRLQR